MCRIVEAQMQPLVKKKKKNPHFHFTKLIKETKIKEMGGPLSGKSLLFY